MAFSGGNIDMFVIDYHYGFRYFIGRILLDTYVVMVGSMS